MKVYVDVSEFIKIDAITGIQRVMREILLRFLKSKDLEVVLMTYSEKNCYFSIIDNDRFIRCFDLESLEKNNIYSNVYLTLNEFENDSVFFDLDVSWSATVKRSYLLPILKKKRIKIVAQIYDIMAITHFQYFTEHFTFTFMEYIGAHIQYADLIIVSTNTSLEILKKFACYVGVEHINGKVAYLGADFKQKNSELDTVSIKIKEITKARKYILMVGTIEPRKNHKLVLDAFDKELCDLGYDIIFAGRIGWKNEELLERIKKHPLYEKRIFLLNNATNAEIDYLYKAAFLVAFPTHMEGFGLPLVEALERGTPVIASDIEVLKEIGGDYCYYFAHDDVEKFISCIKNIEKNAEKYDKKREYVKKYKPVSWDESAKIMINAILSLR